MSTLQSRSFCFTWNNPEGLIDFDEFPYARYLVFQLEMGESGTPHFQGYIEFNRATRGTVLQRVMDGVHLEVRQGTREQARDYCKKEEGRLEGPWEFGQWSEGGTGARNDLAQLKQAIDSGASRLEVWEEHFKSAIKYHRGMEIYRQLKYRPRDWEMQVELFYGDTGTGKSRRAREENPVAYWNQGSKWFDLYDGEEVIVLDEFLGWLPFNFLLRLCDRYPLLIESKGGQLQCQARKIVITSNKRPEHWYSSEKVAPHLPAFWRRLSKLVWFQEGKPALEFSGTDLKEKFDCEWLKVNFVSPQ